MKWFFLFGVVFSILFGIISNKMSNISIAIIGSSTSAINLFFSICGAICFWSGIMKIAQDAKITSAISKIFKPIFKKLFNNPSDESIEAVSMNVSANLLGLGNAATPFGLEAMKKFKESNNNKNFASHNMILFCVLNTSALQIIPTTVATLRFNNGSTDPMKILCPTLLSSSTALLSSIVAVKIFSKIWGKKNK